MKFEAQTSEDYITLLAVAKVRLSRDPGWAGTCRFDPTEAVGDITGELKGDKAAEPGFTALDYDITTDRVSVAGEDSPVILELPDGRIVELCAECWISRDHWLADKSRRAQHAREHNPKAIEKSPSESIR